LLLWPKGEPAGGAWFLLCTAGVSNGIFVLLFAIARAGYDAMWYRAHYRNRHRDAWLARHIRLGRKPLRVLGVGYSLPLGGQTLAQVINTGTRLPRPQLQRSGSSAIEHCRFDEPALMLNDPRIAAFPYESENETAAALPQPVALLALRIAAALEPLAASLRALTRYEAAWWPQVRVLAETGEGATREQQVRDALRIAGLPPLAVEAVPAEDGLLVADAWLDAHERRPLLLIAPAWHERQPPVGSTEGCICALLDAAFYRLPGDVRVFGTLHRPVEGKSEEAEYGFANAALWGTANVASVARAWITRPVERCNRALRIANLDGVANCEAQCEPARIVGDAGNASGWLSIVAAIECDAADGPQLVVDGIQSAILHVNRLVASDNDLLLKGPAEHDRPETQLAHA